MAMLGGGLTVLNMQGTLWEPRKFHPAAVWEDFHGGGTELEPKDLGKEPGRTPVGGLSEWLL